MSLKLNLIAAACENMGIGINGNLPWKLKSEMAHFTKMTTVTSDPNKKNIALMGRNTWDCIPSKFRPLKDRINLVLSRNPNFKVDNEEVIVCNSLQSALHILSGPEYADRYENIWVVGGSYIYNEAMKSKHFYRLYLTEIKANFDCDTFMPKLTDNLKIVEDPSVPAGENEENGIKFVFKVYENTNFNK